MNVRQNTAKLPVMVSVEGRKPGKASGDRLHTEGVEEQQNLLCGGAVGFRLLLEGQQLLGLPKLYSLLKMKVLVR